MRGLFGRRKKGAAVAVVGASTMRSEDDAFVVVVSCDEMEESIQTQKKLIMAQKGTRKCSGTTEKLKQWTGNQIDQYRKRTFCE
jgi:hypothetical protein